MFSYTYFDNLKLLGICDEELLGKTLHGEVDIIISEKFYGSSKADEKEILKLVREADNINCFGDKIVSLLIKEGIVDERFVMVIDGVKHAQVYKI